MTLYIVIIVLLSATALSGLYLIMGPSERRSGMTIKEEKITPIRAVGALPMIDEKDTGSDPSGAIEISALEAAAIADEPDLHDLAITAPEVRKEMEELGYKVTTTSIANNETVIDAFDDGRCYFPAPETPGFGDDLTPVDFQ